MKVQKDLLTRYKNQFPNETLKQTQAKTGIHYTRVFRIYNGSEMKLNEYLIFQDNLLEEKESQIEKKLSQCIRSLSESHRDTLFKFIDKTLFFQELRA